ncbi:DUF4149 domain-containing protein [Pseudoduganella sp.]|uniref:DUF4149 domain-containing protein n=1 Tax=Pseudoduganella sp. TaxID=1880898 RepID=UPI0035AF1DF7
MALDKVRLLVAALWAGSLWAVGYLVAPTLFATLDRQLAGQIAGSMFHSMALLSLGCGAAMGVLLFFGTRAWTPKRRRTVLLIVVAMVMCTVASHFGLQPLMAAAKAANDGSFGKLHGISSTIYLVQSLLAGWLLWKQA